MGRVLVTQNFDRGKPPELDNIADAQNSHAVAPDRRTNVAGTSSDSPTFQEFVSAWLAAGDGAAATGVNLGPLASVYRDVLHGIIDPHYVTEMVRADPLQFDLGERYVAQTLATVVWMLQTDR